MTTTVIESFDAQMLDYQNDHDVQMHVSSSDPWLQDMVPMEDDGQIAFQPKGTVADSTPTVEVDMEAYIDAEHIEYEMADDNHGHNPTSAELLDVDLLDASAVQSPSVTVAPLPTTPSVEYSQTQFTARISSTSDLSPPVPPVPPKHTAVPTAVVDSAAAAPSTPENPIVEAPQADISSSVIEPPSDFVLLPESVAYHTNDGAEQVVDHETHHSGGASPEYHDAVRQSSVAAQSVAEPHPGTEKGATLNSTFSATIEDQGESHRLDSDQGPSQPGFINKAGTPVTYHGPVEPRASEEAVEGHLPGGVVQNLHVNNGDTYVERESVAVPAPPEESWGAVQQNQTEGDVLLTTQTADQPAEASNSVSEEAYLEAPPPILLSIFSTDHPELCLFNKPPDPLPDEDDTQERHILLQQTPTLYYEALDQAFEVLRQDEYVSTVLEVAGNELALEAYELGLAITEDNIHAREISLHDIHALHDSADLSGPLRLRLYISGPRFIVRYHMLQQGMVKLHVDEAQIPEHEEIEDSDVDELHEGSEHMQHHFSGAETAALEQQPEPGQLEDAEGQPEEESEHLDGDYESSYDEAEGTMSYTGEIDLSALPPFVDSPDASGEGEQAENNENADLRHAEIATGDNVVTDEDRVEEVADTENPQSPSQEEGAPETRLPDTNQDSSPEAEQAVHDLHGNFNEEHISVPGSPGTRHDASETCDGEGQGQPSTQENTDKTPQPEHAEITDEEPRNPEHTNEELHGAEGEAVGDQPVNAEADSNDIEELKDFEGDLGETWDDELDGEGDPDTTWEAEQENDEHLSNESSVTLSSKASKRSFDEYEFEDSDDENPTSESPGTKRPRVA